MKKFLSGMALLMAICVNANAQFNLGLQGGVNFSTLDSKNFNNSAIAGYQVGVFARFGGSIYLQPEIDFSSTGGQLESEDNTFGENVRFTNFDIPILLGVRFGLKKLNIRIMAGPDYDYIINTSQADSQNINSALYGFSQYKSSTIGYQAGVGVDIGAITADLRYEGNFTSINSGNGSQRQYLWALSVGYKFL